MSLFFSDTVTGERVIDAAAVAEAAYKDGDIPEGWSVLGAADLTPSGGFAEGGFKGNYWVGDDALLGAPAAIVLRKGDTIALGFRGTETSPFSAFVADVLTYPALVNGNGYIYAYAPLLAAITAYAAAEGLSDILVAGHSLGGGAANQLAAESKSNPAFALFKSADIVAFGSPTVRNADVFNIGFRNDSVFKLVEREFDRRGSFDSTADRLFFADGRFATSDATDRSLSPHDLADYMKAVKLLAAAPFAAELDRDTPIVFGSTGRRVELEDLPRFDSPVHFIGDTDRDIVRGTTRGDVMFGNDGDDILKGGRGADRLYGGEGRDIIEGGLGKDRLMASDDGDVFRYSAPLQGGDTIFGFSSGQDQIALDAGDFRGLGAITPRFRSGEDIEASGRKAQLLYDTATGELTFDANGARRGGEELLATLDGAPVLKASDIFLF